MEFDFDPAEKFPNIKVKVTKRYIPTDEVMRYTFYITWNYSKFNKFIGWTEWSYWANRVDITDDEAKSLAEGFYEEMIHRQISVEQRYERSKAHKNFLEAKVILEIP